jgi:hypothetical protein
MFHIKEILESYQNIFQFRMEVVLEISEWPEAAHKGGNSSAPLGHATVQ